MRSIPLALAVGLATVLVQACGGGGGDDGSGSPPDERDLSGQESEGTTDEPSPGQPVTYVDHTTGQVVTVEDPGGIGLPSGTGQVSCLPRNDQVEGSSATYRFERADGSTEDVTATVSETTGDSTTFVLEGSAGAYDVVQNHVCDGSAGPGSTTLDDPVARVLLSWSVHRFDEKVEEVTQVPADGDPCHRRAGSEEVELFGDDRTVNRCVLRSRLDADGEEIIVTTEAVNSFTSYSAAGVARSETLSVPVAGLIFKERVRANGEVDRVRLIDWNGL